MLKFIVGGAGTGKSTRIREEISALTAAGKPVYCIVPEQYSFESERTLYPTGAEVYSMERLADAVFRRCGGLAGEYADETVQLLLMQETLRDLKGQLPAFGRSAARPDFASEMLRTVGELRRAGLSPEALLDAALLLRGENAPLPGKDEQPPGVLELKLRDLSLILDGYEAALSRSFLDPMERLARACDKIEENGFFVGSAVFVDEYKSFSAVQQRLLGLAMRQTESLTVSLCIEEERAGSGIFDGLEATRRALKSAAARAGVPVAPELRLTEPRRFTSPALARFVSGLFSAAPAVFPADKNGEVPGIKAFRLTDGYGEASFAAAEIARLVREEGYAYEEIAVLSRDMETRAPSLEAAFDRYKIPYFLSGGRTVEAMPLIRFVRHLLRLVVQPLDREESLMLLKCALQGHSERQSGEETAGGFLPLTEDEVSAFEQYTYVWDLTGFSFRRPFTRDPAGFSEREMDERGAEKLALAEKARQTLVGLYDDFRAAAAKDGIAKGLYYFLTARGIDKQLQAECDALLESGEELEAENLRLSWESLIDFIDAAAALTRLRGESGEEIGMNEFSELLRTVAAATPLVTRPQTLDSVLVGDLSTIRTGEKRCVLLLGCNEGLFPRLPEPSGTLTNPEREKLAALGLPITGQSAELIADERFSAYKACGTPSEQLILTFAAAETGGGELAPSEVILSLQTVFPGIRITDGKFLSPYFYCAGPSTAFLQAARLPDGDERRTIEAALKNEPGWRERLGKLSRAAGREALALRSPELSRALFAPLNEPDGTAGAKLSPSQVEQFYACPFAYFCRYGLGVRSPAKAELNPLARGSIIHFLLQAALSEKDFLQKTEEELDRLTLSLLARYLDGALGGNEEKSAKFLYYFYRLQPTVREILSVLQAELSQSEFQVCGLEEVIAAGGKVEPLRIRGNGITLTLQGKIDRLDAAQIDGEEYVRVIDYKTGGKAFKLEEAEKGLNLQMLLYLFAATQRESGAFAGASPAGILYMPAGAKNPIFGRGEGGGEEKRKLYRMNGLVLDDERVLRAMERDGSGGFIDPPSSRNKKSARIPLEEMEALREKAERLVREMGEGLLEGKIAPNPQGSGGRLPCTWCEYKVICGR